MTELRTPRSPIRIPIRAYLLHLRPRSWPIVAAHFATGYFCATGQTMFFREDMEELLAGALLWAVCLNGGTLAVNSAFDRDRGNVGYLENPPPIPRGLFAFGLALMLLGGVVAYVLCGRYYPLLYGICALMSITYSCPPLRLKDIPGADLLINATGYGALTFAAGAAIWTGSPFGHSVLAGDNYLLFAAVGFGLVFAGFYPLTQLYQLAGRRERNWAGLLGKKLALRCALTTVSGGLFLLTLTFFFPLVPFEGGPARFLASVLVALAWWRWLSILIRWLRRAESYSRQEEEAGMYGALTAWGLTDLAIILSAVS